MASPAVSVILPVYNGEEYLCMAIESVLKQTFQDYELIIVDDGSRDSTPEIAQSYGSRVKYVRQANTGVAGAFNHGLSLASGRYISWLSHDDVFYPTKIEKQIAALEHLNEAAVCYTDIEFINSAGEVISDMRLPEYERGDVLRHVLGYEEIAMASYSICYDRRCVEEVGRYSERWPYTQDAEMLARLARRFPFVRVPQLLMQVREHENRGVRSAQWEREVVRFFRYQLAHTPLSELFPNIDSGASRADRSQACLSLGDSFATKQFPLYRVAYSQYLRALRENPADVRRLVRRIVGLFWRKRKERT